MHSDEGADRPDLRLAPRDDAMAAAITAAQPRTIVALNNPGAVVMPWALQAGAILAAWYPGQEMGNALAVILWGDIVPSGRLPLTFPLADETPMETPQQWPGVGECSRSCATRRALPARTHRMRVAQPRPRHTQR